MAEGFTKAQIRAVAAVERFTDMEPHYYGYLGRWKRAIGACFSLGDFATAEVRCAIDGGRLDYHVAERSACLIFGHAHASRGEALAEARELITEMGAELLADLIHDRRAALADKQAEMLMRNAARSSKSNEPKPRKIGKRARAVFDASGGKCHYCEAALTLDGRWHIEHKIPRALFGGSEQANLVASCAPCNHAKRDKTDLEFMALRAEPPLSHQQQ